MMIKSKFLAAAVALGCAGVTFAQKGETVKMVRIDPLTGLLGPVGVSQIKGYQFFAEKFSGAGNPAGVKFQITAIDNKLSPAESLNALKAAIDQGVRYIIQGNGSSVALALTDAVTKHNERNPGKEVIYLNDSAVDPDLTNSKCSYWHFRFDADTSMKMEAMSSFMVDQKDIKKIYILGQNYSHGVQVAKYTKETLARKRPDIQIVGEDLHPLAQVRDFAPYIAKIKASGADTVITSNWGTDLTLLLKAAKDYGLNINFFTMNANNPGVPAQMGSWGENKVSVIWNWGHNAPTPELEKIYIAYQKQSNEDFIFAAHYNIVHMLTAAMDKAKSTEPKAVAYALEGMKFKSPVGEVEMRKTDHQLLAPLFMGMWAKQGSKGVKYDAEKTGYGFRSEVVWDAYVSAQPTSCQMKRP